MCRWLHSEPFELPPAGDNLEVAIHIRYEPGALTELVERATSSAEVLDRHEEQISARDAVRLRTRSVQEAMLPPGTETVSWFVAAGPRTMVGSTTSASEGDFADATATLEGVMRSLQFSAEFACSAVGLAPRSATADLPAAVAATRDDLLRASVACDFEALGQLASRGDAPFTFTFGAGDDPAAAWQAAELDGADVTRVLALLLALPPAARAVEGTTQYVWPRAYVAESWDSVAQEDRDDLAAVYPPEEIAQFAAAGTYLGHRVGITADGEWMFFVAGD